MKEKTPLQLAGQYVDLVLKGEVLPPDDIDLSSEMALERQRRVMQESSGYLVELEELLTEAPISPFFKGQLLHEARLGSSVGWTGSERILHFMEKELGISVENGQGGFFDPEHALDIEKRYFRNARVVLQWRERNGIPNPVDWRDWQRYIAEKGD